MNRFHIPGFPNRMPSIYWLSNSSVFKDEKVDNVALHLIKFRMHVCKIKVRRDEDCLMKMFMASLEGKSRLWYVRLPDASIYSL